MGAKRDLTGQRFGKLVVRADTGRRGKGGGVFWACDCDCGATTEVIANSLQVGNTISCGCWNREFRRIQPKYVTHGLSRTKEYAVWSGIKQRCLNPKCRKFRDYGARGVMICERWRNSFAAFYADMGPRPDEEHSIDRYPDTTGHYEPGNCRWAVDQQQRRNTRRSRPLTLNGETLLLCEWAERLGLDPNTIGTRLKSGMSVEDALTRPLKVQRKQATPSI